MTLVHVMLWPPVALLFMVFVPRLFHFLDGSAQYQLKQLRELGLEECGVQPVH